jgi:pimeloyl-ACP methyl ester carboxylesterase
MADIAARYGLRTVLHARPGYAGSTPLPGRSVADVAADVAVVVDALGADEFVTVGWSGGGPHALATAALLPDRCLGAATIAGVAPYAAAGLDWLAGMGVENIEEFGAAVAGEPALGPGS